MHPDIQKLLEVQKVDMVLARIDRDLRSVPEERARRQKKLDEVRASAAAARRAFDEGQVRSRESELSIKGADEEIKKLEARLNTVKNNAEYQATLLQIESVRKERNALEEEGLALLEGVEGLRQAADEAKQRLAQEEATFAEFEAKAAGVVAEGQAERAEVAKGREGLLEGIQKELLEKYQTIFQVREGMAVSAVEGGHCTGCYSSITPNDMARLQGKSSIVQCGSCQRLLYLPS